MESRAQQQCSLNNDIITHAGGRTSGDQKERAYFQMGVINFEDGSFLYVELLWHKWRANMPISAECYQYSFVYIQC